MTEVKEQNEKVVDIKEQQENNTKNKSIIKLPIKHPIEVDEVIIDSITLDFSKVTGEDVLAIDEQLRLEGGFFDNLFNQKVLLYLASRAANIKVEDLQQLHVADYLEVTLNVRNFFFQW